jgi:hypothetical protein
LQAAPDAPEAKPARRQEKKSNLHNEAAAKSAAFCFLELVLNV